MTVAEKYSSLEAEGRAIVEHQGGRWTQGRGGMCLCPAHKDGTPSLSVRLGRKRLLLHCFAGCEAAAILAALKAMRVLGRMPPLIPDAPTVADDETGFARAATRIWTDARIISGTPAERYLLRRGIQTQSPELRYNPRAPLGRKPQTQFRPALIAAVRDDAGLVGVHRTFLDRRTGRLAALPDPKLGLGRFGSGAVRLGGSARRLGLAEGLETALSASILFGVPCWATLGTERFRHIRLPAEVEELLLFLDNDAAGRRAEAFARETFTTVLSIEAHRPSTPGYDWNDVLGRSRRATRSGLALNNGGDSPSAEARSAF